MVPHYRRNVMVLHVAFSFTILSACQAADWPQFRGSQTLSGAASALPGTLLVPVWTMPLPTLTSGGITYSPSITASAAIATVTIQGTARRVAFVASRNTHVYAFDAATGNQLWEVPVYDRVESSPLVKDDVLYLTTNSGNLMALNASDGSVLWSHASGGLEDRSSPNFSGGNIVCAASFPKTTIYAVPIGSGNPAPEAWHYATEQFIYSSPAVDPATQNIYCGSDDGKLYALKSDGTPLWAQPFETTGGIFRASPAIGNGKVYLCAADYDWALHAVDAATGTLVWDAPMRPVPDPSTLADSVYKSIKVSSPAVSGSFVCVAGGYCSAVGTTHLYAFQDNGATAQPLWKTELPNVGQEFLSSPAITPASVIVGVAAAPDPAHPNYPTGRLYVLDRATGTPVWYAAGSASHTGGPILASPAVSGDLVIVGDTAGVVTAYQSVIAGDVDGDANVTALDAVALMGASSGDGQAAAYQVERADVYPTSTVPSNGLRSFGDGLITPADVDRVLRRAVGLEPALP